MATLTKILLLSVLFIGAHAGANEVFSWKNPSGSTSYSDVPRNLQPAQVNRMNVRTHSVTRPPAPAAAAANPESLAEQQQKLGEQIARQNKQIEEQNKRVEEENRRREEENCQAARINRQFAESARVNNRDALIARYDGDIAKFCN